MDLINIVQNCREIELAIASIYRTFIGLFPDVHEFWEDLYRDELEHSYWLSDERNIEAIDLLPSEELIPSKELIESTLGFIQSIATHIKYNPVTLEDALKIALKLEESMIETFTNELTANLFASDYDSLTEKIIAAEKIHINKIEDMMISKGFLQLS